jgi:hypothetical protein
MLKMQLSVKGIIKFFLNLIIKTSFYTMRRDKSRAGRRI